MFSDPVGQVFAHSSVLKKGNFTTPEFILNQRDERFVNLFKRHCPHRMYPLSEPGTSSKQNILCKFHGYEWSPSGVSLNNTKKLSCSYSEINKTGMIMRNFLLPNHQWVHDLEAEKNLEYSHCLQGKSDKGSWLWLMDAEADLLHVRPNGIHPFLSQQVKISDIKKANGEDWIYQEHPDGWWLYIFPFTFIEYGRNGCVMLNYTIPHNPESEFGYDWITQFYYDPKVDVNVRFLFETAESVFKEDVATSELQKGPYFPLMHSQDPAEDHCLVFGNWFNLNSSPK